MQLLAFILACVACGAHSSLRPENFRSQQVSDVFVSSQPLATWKESTDALKAFAVLLVTSQPIAALNPSGAPLRSSVPVPPATSNAIAACIAAVGAIGAASTAATSRPTAAASCYMAASVAGYCLRRGQLHGWRDGRGRLGAGEVLYRHVAYDDDWHLPKGSPVRGRILHLAHILLWLLLFHPLYPVLEVLLFPFDLAAFWFYYPQGRGCGLIVDSCKRLRNGAHGNRSQVFRLDWHRFKLNANAVDPQVPWNTPGYFYNLPHIDLPQQKVRHWPWRQHPRTFRWLLKPTLR